MMRLVIIKEQRMLRYILISVFFVVSSNLLFAQDYTNDRSQQTTDRMMDEEEGTPRPPKEKKIYPHKRRGTAINVDISRFLLPAIDPGTIAGEVGLRTNFMERMFIVGQIGYENVRFENDLHEDPSDGFVDKPYSYRSNGFYGRIGVDYDVFIVDEPGNNDNVLFGLSYGYAFQNHESPSVIIRDDYWGHYETSFPKYGVSTHWLEFTFGLRTQIVNNFYMSWFIRVKGKLATNNSDLLVPYRVPGYGKGSNPVNLGFSYKLEYLIPWGNKGKGHL